MQLVELLMQGVKDHPPQARLRFGAGHLVVLGEAPLLPLLRSALFSDGSGPDDEGRSLAANPGARVGLVFRDRDRRTWRLIRALHGSIALQQQDEGSGRFLPAASGAEVGPLLRAQLGVPSRARFDALLTFDPRRWRGGDEPAAAPPVPRQELAASVADLERELVAIRQVEDLQRRLDELLHEQSVLERARDAIATAEGRVSSARASLGRFEPFAELEGLSGRVKESAPQVRDHSLSSDVGPDRAGSTPARGDEAAAVLEVWAAAERERSAALRRVAEEREVVEQRAARGVAAAPWRDARFLAAGGVGLAALVAGLFSPLRIVALLNVPAFGVAAALAVRWVGQLQQGQSGTRLAALLEDRERKIDAEWEQATAPVREAMARVGADRPEELAEGLRARAESRKVLAAAEAQLAEVRSLHTGKAERFEALEVEVQALEERLAGLAAGAYRPRQLVEAELEERRALFEGRQVEEGARLGSALPGALAAALPPTGEQEEVDPALELIEHAAQLLLLDRHELGGRIAPRVGQFLGALSEGRLPAVELSSAAGLRCAGAGGSMELASLPPDDRLLAGLALHLALVEQVIARGALPVIYDDPFASLGEPQRLLLFRILRGLGKRTQVIHRTGDPGARGFADAVAEVA